MDHTNYTFMTKMMVVTLSLLVCLTLAAAREVWMHPAKFVYNKGEKLEVTFKVGENFIGEAWDLKRDKVEKLELYQIGKHINLLDSLNEGVKNNLGYILKEEGTHLLVMQQTNVFNERSADEFNTYLREGGLEDIADQWKNATALTTSVKEYSSWYTKLLFQVGSKLDDTYKKATDFPVDLIPEENPNGLRIGEAVRFKVLFNGKPIFGVRAKVWNRFNNRTTIQNIYTEQDGTFEARISNPGPWMITVGRMIPLKQASADWQTYWSSFVFGIEK